MPRCSRGAPYAHPTIGSMADLDAATLEDVHAFYERWYGPRNTVLTLCGDVEAEDASSGWSASSGRFRADLAWAT